MTIKQLDKKLDELWAEAPVKAAFGNEQFEEMLSSVYRVWKRQRRSLFTS